MSDAWIRQEIWQAASPYARTVYFTKQQPGNKKIEVWAKYADSERVDAEYGGTLTIYGDDETFTEIDIFPSTAELAFIAVNALTQIGNMTDLDEELERLTNGS